MFRTVHCLWCTLLRRPVGWQDVVGLTDADGSEVHVATGLLATIRVEMRG